MNNIPIVVLEQYNLANVLKNPNILYVFGDNAMRVGSGGQAHIRSAKNTTGIATKMSISEYFYDENFEQSKNIIDNDISRIIAKMERGEYNILAFPKAGFGWGRAEMQTHCPKTALYLCSRLLEEFGFNNIQDLVNTRRF